MDTTEDALDEADETLSVTLSDPSSAVLIDGTATGVIIDDDPLPSVSIGNGSATEGDAGCAFRSRCRRPQGAP